jgi:tetratricopeptide (TPR) repeat protein
MDRRRQAVGSLVLFTSLAASSWASAAMPLEQAIRLRDEGRNREAQQALSALLPALRGSSDRTALARALTAATDASLALGDYESAIGQAREAFDVHQQLGQRTDAAWDLNAVGLANHYLGRYDRALESYQQALALDRASGDGDGEVTRLNNIGNVHFMRGRYSDALRRYEEALAQVETRTTDASRARLRKMSISNLAALQQRLGADQRALDLYAQLRAGEVMQPSEEAQLLINQGALLRRLGDPVRAMETYRQAQALFARAQHRDGEIGAWRNIGIAYALDLQDRARALAAFDEALRLARGSSNQLRVVQALLYRGETYRRMGRLAEASADLRAALDDATRVGLVEERWKALHGLGRVVEAQGRGAEAARSYEQALAAIESVRADLQGLALRSEFLADKRDVYDALIARRLAEPSPSAPAVFELIERSRARTWQDRLQPGGERLALHDVQPKMAPGTLLLEYWTGTDASALVWASPTAAGIARQAAGADDIAAIQRFADVVKGPGDDWRPASSAAGGILLAGLPDLRGVSRLLVVRDGPLHFVPFEALTVPGAQELVVERFEVSYLPSAALLVRRPPAPARRWMWPWQREMLAFGDPPVTPGTTSAEGEPLAGLSHADEEIRGIAAYLPARAVLHLGERAQKRYLLEQSARVPLLHFATHAVADMRDPERSRILLAPASPSGAADHLFLREIYDLDLAGVQLATLSACQTERGKVIRGEGVEGFSRALLAAGAASAVTTLWDVVDRAGAEFMKQFYFALARGDSAASALREAKRRFLRSELAWSHPRYWAGYVLSGDGRERLPRVVPWSALAGALALFALAAATAARRHLRRRS